jgi:hypothetical protein
MLEQKKRIIHERGIQIPIPKTSPSCRNSTSKKNNYEEINYGLNNNIFDPTKSSPPNDFLLKLQKRMEMFEILQNI